MSLSINVSPSIDSLPINSQHSVKAMASYVFGEPCAPTEKSNDTTPAKSIIALEIISPYVCITRHNANNWVSVKLKKFDHNTTTDILCKIPIGDVESIIQALQSTIEKI